MSAIQSSWSFPFSYSPRLAGGGVRTKIVHIALARRGLCERELFIYARPPRQAGGYISISSCGRGAGVGAEDADEDALDADVFVDVDGGLGIGGLQADAGCVPCRSA